MSASHYLAFSSHNSSLKLALASVGWTMMARQRLKEHDADLRDFYTVNFNRALRFSFTLRLTLLQSYLLLSFKIFPSILSLLSNTAGAATGTSSDL